MGPSGLGIHAAFPAGVQNLTPISDDCRVRRSRSLVIYYEGKSLVFENFLRRTKVKSHPLLTDLLSESEGFQTIAFIKQRFSGATLEGWDETLRALIEQGILIVEGSEADLREARLDTWKWDLPARYYHFATKDVRYNDALEGERSYFLKLATIEPPPSIYKDYQGKFLTLQSPRALPRLSLEEVLRKRRTHRWFNPEVVSLERLSQLLFYTWGKTASVDKGLIDQCIRRTSPSGGCRHPIEVYPILFRVHGIPAGTYHYSVRRHGLELLKLGDFEEAVMKFASDQPWLRHASAFFVMTGIFPRSMWRYRFSRAYRVVQLDAGHLGQTFQLVSTCLGLDSFITAALQDSLIEAHLEIDGINESVLYAGAIGHASDEGPR